MVVLILNFFVCCLIAFLIYFGSKDSLRLKNTRFFFISLFLVVCVHGFVDPETLPDVPVYKNVFDRLALKPIYMSLNDAEDAVYGENFETGFKFVLSVVGHIWKNISFFLFLNSIAICYLYYKFFKKYSPVFPLSVLLFLLLPFNQSLFVIRQHLALAILLSSYDFVIDRKFWKFLLVVVASSLIHMSSLIFLPIYFLYGIRGRKLFFLMFLLGIITTISIKGIISLLFPIMENNDRYAGYLSAEDLNIATKGIIMLVFLILYIMLLKGKIFNEGIAKLIFVISLWGTLFNLVLGEIGAGRLFLSYYVILIIQIPFIVFYLRSRFVKYLFVLLTLTAFFVFSFMISVTSQYLPPINFLFF